MSDQLDEALGATRKRVDFAICDEARLEMTPEDILEMVGEITRRMPNGQWHVIMEEKC